MPIESNAPLPAIHAIHLPLPASDLWERLSAHFPPTDIEWRIGQAGKKDDGTVWAKAFAYITNRAIQDRLDQVVGPGNWKNEYRPWEIGTPGVLCGLSLRIDGEWVTKWDGAEQTDMEALKGGLSSAMKRAAVQWGIGRYLYDLPEGWAKVGPNGVHYASNVKVKVGGQEQRIAFKWDPPDLPKWALPDSMNGGPGPVVEPPLEDMTDQLRRQAAPAPENVVANPGVAGSYVPTEKQVAFYKRLADAPVFTPEERSRAYLWLETKATKQTIKDQIDWLKRQVETRRAEAQTT